MNKKRFFLIFSLILALLIFTFSNSFVLADAGNNNRYDVEVDYSDNVTSNSDSGFFNLIIYLLFELFGPLPGIILLIILFIWYIKMKKSGKFNNIQRTVKRNVQAANMPIVDKTNDVAAKVREVDPNFSSDKFIGWVREVFLKIQKAWTDRNWEIIRPFESNELFSLHSSQLEEYIKNNKINVVEKIAINYCGLSDFYIDGDKEVMVVRLRAVMRDYVIDATSKKVLESDPNTDWYMNYILTFNRKVGVKTKEGTSNKTTTNCPNCGAPTDITSAGKCKYCDSVITTGEHDWVLSDIRKE